MYLTPEKTILKLAKNDKGIAQNKAESHPKVKSKYINKILAYSKKYTWIETVYLDKMTEKVPVRVTISQAANLFGVNEKTIRRAIRDAEVIYIVVRGVYKINFESLLRWSQSHRFFVIK